MRERSEEEKNEIVSRCWAVDLAVVTTLDLGTCSRCNVMTAGDSIMPSAWLNANRCGAMKSYTVVV